MTNEPVELSLTLVMPMVLWKFFINLLAEKDSEEAVGLGQYVLDPSMGYAEVAFVVRDDWQGKGLGMFLARDLIRIAQEKEVRGITAVVMPDNRAMLHLFYKLGFTVESRLDEGAYQISFKI